MHSKFGIVIIFSWKKWQRSDDLFAKYRIVISSAFVAISCELHIHLVVLVFMWNWNFKPLCDLIRKVSSCVWKVWLCNITLQTFLQKKWNSYICCTQPRIVSYDRISESLSIPQLNLNGSSASWALLFVSVLSIRTTFV